MMIRHCKHCGSSIETDIYSVNYMLFCPECLKLTEAISEYGYGNPYPVDCFMGFHKIASIDRIDGKTVLKRYREEDITLNSDSYSDVLKEAQCVIEKWLKG